MTAAERRSRSIAPSAAQTRWGLLVLVWTVPAAISMLQTFANMVLQRETVHWQYMAVQLPIWYAWVLITPLVLWLGRRYPVERDRWPRALAIHFAAALAITIVHSVAFTALQLRIAHLVEPASPLGAPTAVIIARSTLGRLLVDLFTYGAILGVGTAIDYGRRYREREVRAAQLESQLAGAQLAALKMQLQPHFLFNTLHAIGVLAADDPPAARRMIALLGDLLRMTLARAGDQEVPLDRELEYVRLYLEIERTRFQDRLTVRYDVAPEARRALVPDMILQPVVENAIKHGIAATPEAGHIVLAAERRDGRLVVRVTDDGPGPTEGGASTAGNGVGLAATRARLAALYGGAQRLELRAAALPAVGCEVVIELPFREAAP